MVGWLVEYQQVHAVELKPRQRGPRPLPRRQQSGWSGHIVAGETELGQQGSDLGHRRRWIPAEERVDEGGVTRHR